MTKLFVGQPGPATPGLSIIKIHKIPTVGATAVGVTAVRNNLEF